MTANPNKETILSGNPSKITNKKSCIKFDFSPPQKNRVIMMIPGSTTYRPSCGKCHLLCRLRGAIGFDLRPLLLRRSSRGARGA